MIYEVLVFVGMDQQCVISDNAYFPHEGGEGRVSDFQPNDHKGYGHFSKKIDIYYFNLISVVSNGFNCTNIS